MAGYDGWVFPVPRLNGSHPRVSDGFGTPESGKRSGRGHLGVDIMYRRAANGEHRPPELSRGFMMPSDIVPALCAFSGNVFRVNRFDSHGISVTIDHHQVSGLGPRVTVYRHLKDVFVTEGQIVAPGTELGIIGKDISNGDRGLNHLHFELWDTSRPPVHGKTRDSFAIDPGTHASGIMSRWLVFDRDKGDLVNQVPFAVSGLATFADPALVATATTEATEGEPAPETKEPTLVAAASETTDNDIPSEAIALMAAGGLLLLS